MPVSKITGSILDDATVKEMRWKVGFDQSGHNIGAGSLRRQNKMDPIARAFAPGNHGMFGFIRCRKHQISQLIN